MLKSQRSYAEIASVAGTVILVICAATTTAIVAKREYNFSVHTNPGAFTEQKDWQKYIAGGHRLGPDSAQVVLVEFADFECPACRKLEQTLVESRKRFPDKIAVVYRHFPLNIHRHARAAAEASECAALQGKFEQMHSILFQSRDSLGITPWRTFAALSHVPDIPKFEHCMRDSTTLATVTRDRKAAEQLGAIATPTILINGTRFAGAIPQEQLDSLIAAAIKSAR
ncbi:MAG: thioredoxin domain-containing protein [Gemmatimonadaceae bacterium]